MKKDMGGAAHALALARLVMKSRLPVRLHLLIPAVENAISGGAFRPGDVLRSRKGLTVEVGNTDAEGRLILGDALTRAAEGKPELILDFATLTGAARIALGPDLPALFANDDALAAASARAAARARPTRSGGCRCGVPTTTCSPRTSPTSAIRPTCPWPAPSPRRCSSRKFVPEGLPWAHFDTYAWRGSAKPGRPKGGDALGLRAAWAALSDRYDHC